MHVPYRATTAAIADVIGGRIELVLVGLSSAKPQIDGGRLRAFGISSPQRSSLLPDVPTMDEAGLPNYYVYSWFGMSAGQDPAAHRRAVGRRDPEGSQGSAVYCDVGAAGHADRRIFSGRTPSLQCGTISSAGAA